MDKDMDSDPKKAENSNNIDTEMTPRLQINK